jgi:catechol 2,3-dioxygenase-like lactoylglutathione lyase family enzyme
VSRRASPHESIECINVAAVTGHAVKAMFHSTAMVADYDRAIDRLGELFGLRVLEYSAATDPAIARRGGMTWIGDGSIEIGEPIVDGAAPDRFVRRTGGGMQGLAVWVDDFETSVAQLAEMGVTMPVVVGHFGFSSPRTTFGLQLEWSGFTVPEDPRRGAPLPASTRTPLLDATNHAFVGAVVDDPVTAARGLADMFATVVTFEDSDAPPGGPVAGVSVGDCTLALYRLLPDESRALWGRTHDRPRVSLCGVRVDDLQAARTVLEGAGVRVLRDAVGALVLDPDTTGGIEVVVVDQLLPRDPRR